VNGYGPGFVLLAGQLNGNVPISTHHVIKGSARKKGSGHPMRLGFLQWGSLHIKSGGWDFIGMDEPRAAIPPHHIASGVLGPVVETLEVQFALALGRLVDH
jgi:hypothetical protein